MKQRTIHNGDGSTIKVHPEQKERSAWSRFFLALIGKGWLWVFLVMSAGAQNTVVSGDRAQMAGDNVFVSSDAATVAAGGVAILSQRTTTAGKTFFVQHIEAYAYLTTPSSTSIVNLGSLAIFTNGVRMASMSFTGGYNQTPRWVMDFSQPIQISSGSVIVSSATAGTDSSVTWMTNFFGYEQ